MKFKANDTVAVFRVDDSVNDWYTTYNTWYEENDTFDIYDFSDHIESTLISDILAGNISPVDESADEYVKNLMTVHE